MMKSELMKRSNNINVPPTDISMPPAETGQLRSGVVKHSDLGQNSGLEPHNNRGSQSHS